MQLLPCHADIVTDGSLGPMTSLLGPDYKIFSNLGQTVGTNLFHSFGLFNINTGESATFTGPAAIDNIISRVTGGSQSFIDGLLRSEIESANLWFINPAGVLFGQHASLDIQGSFHVSTADYLKLGDGGRFEVTYSENSVLTTAPPEAFGFLGERQPGGIAVQGSLLQVPAGETLSVVGGDIQIADGSLYAPGGRIDMVSVASPGEVLPNAPDLGVASFERLGKIEVSHSSSSERPRVDPSLPPGVPGNDIGNVDASGPVGGAVVIRGGQFVMENAFVLAETLGGNDGEKGAGIDIRVGTLDMHSLDQANPALISTITFAHGDGGDVFVEADTMNLRGAGSCGGECTPTGILAQTEGEGDAGKITVHAGQMNVETGATVSTATFSQGKGGNLDIDADNVVLDGEDTGFTTQSLPLFSASAGDAGDIDIKTNGLTLINGAEIRSLTAGPGRGGDISIQADKIFLSGGSLSDPLKRSSITSQQAARGGIGHAGDINVTTRQLEIRNGAEINALTRGGLGQSGDISVTADNILLVGDPSILFTGLSNETQNDGDARNLTVTANTLEIRDNARIEASTLFDQITGANQFSGTGGNITVTANDILISGEGAGIVAKSTNNNPDAISGDIHVIANDSLRLENQGKITVETVLADAGDIDIQVNELLLLSNNSSITTSVADGKGSGGNIRIDPVFTILDGGSKIIAQAKEGRGGDIHITTDFLFQSPDSDIDASSEEGISGTVVIDSPDTDIIGGIIPLPESYFNAAAIMIQSCAERFDANVSSLVVRRYEVLPDSPYALRVQLPKTAPDGTGWTAAVRDISAWRHPPLALTCLGR